jgi:hypothetical protein
MPWIQHRQRCRHVLFVCIALLLLCVSAQTEDLRALIQALYTAYPAERDQPRLAMLLCELQALPLRLQANTQTNAVLRQPVAQQHISATLQTLIVRLQAHVQADAACH